MNHVTGVKSRLKSVLLGATTLALIGSSAIANNGDPGYLAYDGGAQLLGPNDLPVDGSILSLGNIGVVGGDPGAISASLGFQGVTQYDTRALNGGYSFVPPDTMGAVGATQFMETTNGGYAVFDKTTGARTALVSDGAFWTAAGQTQATLPNGLPSGNGDARVLYDSISNKWIVESFAASLDTIQIAVSTTSNALGPWQSTSFVAHAGGIADYPTLAIDSKAVYIGTNDFSAAGDYEGQTLNVINRADLFGAAPTTASLKQFVTSFSAILGGADPGWSIQGVNQLGADSGKVLAVSMQAYDLIRYDVNNPGSPIATLSNVSYLGTTPYGPNNPAAQPGDAVIGGPVIDTLDDRVSSAVWERGGLIYAVHTVTPTGGSHTVVVWTVSNAATNALVQQGTIGGDGYDYFQGAIAVNASGQVVISYDRSSSDLATGAISLFAQTFNPIADGSLVNTSTVLLKVSDTLDYHNGSLDGLLAVGRQRWGDYAQVTVDPNNPESFWIVGEYAAEPNTAAAGHPGGNGATRWGTWVADLTLSAVPEPGTWAMMLLGFGFVGGFARRDRKGRSAIA